MSKLTYFIVYHPVKEIVDDLHLLNNAEEVDVEALNDTAFTSGDSVMTVCDHFLTIYGYDTWMKKFGRKY